MLSDSDLKDQQHILFCPFSAMCKLPKDSSICNFPEYKVCPEYAVRFKRMKSGIKVLY